MIKATYEIKLVGVKKALPAIHAQFIKVGNVIIFDRGVKCTVIKKEWSSTGGSIYFTLQPVDGGEVTRRRFGSDRLLVVEGVELKKPNWYYAV